MTGAQLRRKLRDAIDSLDCFRNPSASAASIGLDLAERLAPAIQCLVAGAHSWDSDLVRRSEKNPLLTKYCLWYDADSDIEIRINHYHEAAYSLDSIHDHKWKFVSMVLSGGVDHYLFRESSTNPLDGFAVRHRTGDAYFVGEYLPHCFVPTPQSLTLMVRGPRTRDSWFRRELASEAPVKLRRDNELKVERRVLTESEYRAFFESWLPSVLRTAGWHTAHG